MDLNIYATSPTHAAHSGRKYYPLLVYSREQQGTYRASQGIAIRANRGCTVAPGKALWPHAAEVRAVSVNSCCFVR
jgi:hypothetical protein